jgi:hypothetical protein
MNVRYRVELSQAERNELRTLLGGGKHAARKLKRVQICWPPTQGAASDDEIATSVGGSTVCRTKRYFVLGNLEAALQRRAAPRASRKLSGKEKTLLIATTCSRLPAGHSRRTLELLADELVRLTVHASLSRETVRRRLAQNDLSRAQGDVVHSAGRWRICRPDGGHARSRSKTPGGLLRREPDAAFRRGPPADPCRSLPSQARSWARRLYFRNNAVTICDRNRFAGCESDEFF